MLHLFILLMQFHRRSSWWGWKNGPGRPQSESSLPNVEREGVENVSGGEIFLELSDIKKDEM